MAKRKKKKYFIKLSNSLYHRFSGYADIYDTLKGELGIVDAAPEAANVQTGSVSQNSRIAKLQVSYQDGTEAGTNEPIIKQGGVFCAPDKIEDALQQLRTNTYKGKNIVDTGFRRRRILV